MATKVTPRIISTCSKLRERCWRFLPGFFTVPPPFLGCGFQTRWLAWGPAQGVFPLPPAGLAKKRPAGEAGRFLGWLPPSYRAETSFFSPRPRPSTVSWYMSTVLRIISMVW